MVEEKTRVDFNAPASLVEQADFVADILGRSRTQVLIDALRAEIDDIVDDDRFQQRLRTAYYDDRIDFEVVESLLGTEDAMRLQLLRDSLNRDPPDPEVDTDLPSDEAFYDEPSGDASPSDDVPTRT